MTLVDAETGELIASDDARLAEARESFDRLLGGMFELVAIASDDARLVEGLDDKTSEYVLRLAEDDDTRMALARAARLRNAPRRRSTSKPPAFVYFIQRGEGGPIKIGAASNPAARLSTLQTGSPEPLRLLAATPGSLDDEAALHERFASARLSGEWFEPTADLIALIEQVAS